MTVESTTGEVFRGKLIEAEDNMNLQVSAELLPLSFVIRVWQLIEKKLVSGQSLKTAHMKLSISPPHPYSDEGQHGYVQRRKGRPTRIFVSAGIESPVSLRAPRN